MTYISCPKKPGTENFKFYYALHKASLVNGTYMYSLEGPIFLKRGLNIFLTLKINFSENQGHCRLCKTHTWVEGILFSIWKGYPSRER